ncbi:Nucleoside-diphosphate-sugar epimerase [Jatrophihabitans endophyticus]|uniref:Nucleoside-diphosphate-sugar epimerase n=1 Tax=Jatrophihabitans endophyticus TaxID=1206085 RepID=A0A1M5CXF4_9ACTN|nr:NAD(P)-dependent oxidoreductase [Jatrophihabitans endophyticus]SHF59428.1 Nucleoside-diphosphate-sugar epimerase [Jatrophihabitans endophyticus]
MRVLVTGSAGFIGGYLVQRLLADGHQVVGVDNYSKYGPVRKSYDDHPAYEFTEGDVRDTDLLVKLLDGCDHLVAGAALIGGISYFHTYAYDLLAANERITASTFDAAIAARRDSRLQKITVVSSSMVYESADRWPSVEGDERQVPPPQSSYGFQKLACEYFARAAWDQYELPFTIVRPFNCVGVGEQRALGDVELPSGNVTLAMSHVVPDLVQKVAKGQDPLHVLGDGSQVRHYTYGADLARGIATAMTHPQARNEDFNLSTARSTTVLELAALIWRMVNGPDRALSVVHDEPFRHDVQRRVPDVAKARSVLGFEASTSLEDMLAEVVPWTLGAIAAGLV